VALVKQLTSNPWVLLIAGGIFEVAFAVCIKLSNGLTKWPYIVYVAFTGVVSFLCLARAMSYLPMGTAYAIWTGIGALGTLIVGIVFFKDPITLGRILLLLNVIVSIVGLRFISN